MKHQKSKTGIKSKTDVLAECYKLPTQGGTTGKHKNKVLLLNSSGCGNTTNCCLPAASTLRFVIFLVSPAVGGWLLSTSHLFLKPLAGQEMKHRSEAAVAHVTPSGMLSDPHIPRKCVSS